MSQSAMLLGEFVDVVWLLDQLFWAREHRCSIIEWAFLAEEGENVSSSHLSRSNSYQKFDRTEEFREFG